MIEDEDNEIIPFDNSGEAEDIESMIENIIKPQLEQIQNMIQENMDLEEEKPEFSTGMEFNPNSEQGSPFIGAQAIVIGGKKGENTEEDAKELMDKIKGYLQEGYDMDYVIREMTDAEIAYSSEEENDEGTMGMKINVLNLNKNKEKVLDAESLERMFEE